MPWLSFSASPASSEKMCWRRWANLSDEKCFSDLLKLTTKGKWRSMTPKRFFEAFEDRSLATIGGRCFCSNERWAYITIIITIIIIIMGRPPFKFFSNNNKISLHKNIHRLKYRFHRKLIYNFRPRWNRFTGTRWKSSCVLGCFRSRWTRRRPDPITWPKWLGFTLRMSTFSENRFFREEVAFRLTPRPTLDKLRVEIAALPRALGARRDQGHVTRLWMGSMSRTVIMISRRN